MSVLRGEQLRRGRGGGLMIKRARGGEFGNGGVREERLVSRDIKFRRDSRRTVGIQSMGKIHGYTRPV